MIYVKRPSKPPAHLDVFYTKDQTSSTGLAMTKAELELEQAIAFFTDPANYAGNKKLTKVKFRFKAYGDPGLRKELDRIFNRKCAYCESKMAHVTRKEIEHFRPKAEVSTPKGKVKPGYYWLATHWDNLLVSCPACNRADTHEVPGKPGEYTLGKASQFPLSKESARVRSHTNRLGYESRHRMLLHPCKEDPEEHLWFNHNGLIHARRQSDGKHSAKGRTSIQVYGLQRKDLVEERKSVLDSFRFQLKQLRHLVYIHGAIQSAPEIQENLNEMQAIFSQLKRFVGRKAPYQAMIRQFILRSNQGGDFASLQRAGIDPMDLLKV
jgi:uncharacterized protein (TIGR02646 family)